MGIKKTTAQLEELIKWEEQQREWAEDRWLAAPAFGREAAETVKRIEEHDAAIIKLCILADIQDGLRQA